MWGDPPRPGGCRIGIIVTCTYAAPRPSQFLPRLHAGAEGSRDSKADDLLAEVATGDHVAFAALYDHMAPAAHGVAYRIVRNESLADEITQDAFLQVWSTGSTFDQTRGSARAWILTIVHRRAVDVVRHEQSAHDRVRRVGIAAFEQPFDSVWATALQHEERAQVWRALGTLSRPQQQAIDLAYYQGMTCGEVADRLDIPVGTVKSRIHDGVVRLRRAFAAPDR